MNKLEVFLTWLLGVEVYCIYLNSTDGNFIFSMVAAIGTVFVCFDLHEYLKKE